MEQSAGPEKSVRLFRNPILEALTHVHPATPVIIFVPVIVWQFIAMEARLGAGAIAGYFLGGLVTWTLVEYVFHRFIFHFDAHSRFGKYLVFLFHGIHHDYPNDSSRLVMPPVVSIILSYGFYRLFLIMLGPIFTKPFFVGFIVGYLFYDFTHFAIHFWAPKTRIGRILKENHMNHHFRWPGALWGVSSPLWDHVFKTYRSAGR